jgi:aspartokinase
VDKPGAEPQSVIKVGGSMLCDRAAYDGVARALASELDLGSRCIVVSAARGVTDEILQAEPDGPAARRLIARHEALLGGPLPAQLRRDLDHAMLEAAAGSRSRWLAWGERASATALQHALAKLGHTLAVVELAPWAPAPSASAIIPGFYVLDRARQIRILPRGGSDISAVVAARWLGARTARLWKAGGGFRGAAGLVLDVVSPADLLATIGSRVRPVHPDAVRLACNSGIEITLEDPIGRGQSTRVTGGAAAVAPPEFELPAEAQP